MRNPLRHSLLRSPAVLPVLLVAGVIVGCETVRPPKQPRLDPYGRSQVHVDSQDLQRETAVGEPIVDRDENGIVRVTLPIRSAVDRSFMIDYRVTFFDRAGQPISRVGPVTKTLQANTPDTIVVNSMSARAADFQIDLRYAQ